MKKYPKMTFAALSAIALNFSCLATIQPSRHIHRVIRTYNNIHYRTLTPLSTKEQISLLKRAISESDRTLAENILTGHLGKIGQRYYQTPREGSFFVQMSDPQFEELQLVSLNSLRRSSPHDDSFDNKQEIFKLITSKFFKVTNNKESAYQTTTMKIYNNLDSFDSNRLDALIDLFPSDDSKMEFVRQLLNYAKEEEKIEKKFGDIFRSLENFYFVEDIPTPSFSIFKNHPWLQPFISEYIEQTRNDFSDMPIKLIKTVAPDCYNKDFLYFLYKCIMDQSDQGIDTLLPRDENNLPLEERRITAEYLNLLLDFLTFKIEPKGKDLLNNRSKYILSSIALYTDPSSDLTDVALTLTRLTKKQCESVLECIKNVNIGLHYLLLKEIQRLKDMNFQPNRVAGLNIQEVQDHLLSTEEQILLLKSSISASNRILVKQILNGCIGKIGSKYYYMSTAESEQEDFFETMSDQQFKELQLVSLNELRHANDSDNSLETKREIFVLITAKFFEVTNNKEQVSKTTASKVYHNLDRFGAEELGELVNRCPSDDSKRAFARQFLNYAKKDNNINAYEKLFSALGELSEIKMFKNQPWLKSFISEYLEHMLSNATNINLEGLPIDFIKEVAPDLYNEKFPTFLKKCITDDATDIIAALLPIDYRNNKYILLENRRLPTEYLNLALESFNTHFHEDKSGSKYILLFYLASYTDPSSDLTDVALTLTKFTQKERQAALKSIKDANSVLFYPLLEKILPFLWH